VSNRLRCQSIDGATLSSSIMVQPETQEDVENLGLTQFGPYSVLPPGLKVVTANFPNVGTQVLPVIRDLSITMGNNTGTYKTRGVQTGEARTKFEVQAQIQQEATLSTAALNLFYAPWKRLLTESYRRLVNDDYTQDAPGGVEAFEFRRRCLERGVTLEMLKSFKSVEPVRAVGFGSSEMRVLALDEFQQLMSQFDDVGRLNLVRDRVAARVGYGGVDRYVPKPNVTRVSQDQKNAEFENTALRMGQPQVVFGDDNALAHLKIHLPALTGLIMAVQQAQAPASSVIAPLTAFVDHTHRHLNKLAEDPSEFAKQAFGQIRQVVSQAEAMVKRLQDQAQAEAQQQQEAMMQQQQQAAQQGGSPENDPRTQAYLANNEAKMKAQREAHLQRMQLHEESAKQKLAIQDIQAAAKLKNQ
jgi:hypothetical protein